MKFIIKKVCGSEQVVFDFEQYENADEADFADSRSFFNHKGHEG